MSQNEEKINQFMEALGEIDPKYVEEARQAVLPGNTPKHTFSVSSLLASIRRWIHAPAVRLVTAACLVLVLVYGVQKAGILSSFSPFGASSGEVDSSSSNSGATSASNRTDSINQESGKDDQVTREDNQVIREDSQVSEEDKKGKENEIEEAAEEDKTISTEPPVLTLHASDETLRSDSDNESTSFINIQSDEYSWSSSQKDGSNSSFGSGTDIWNFANLPVFSTVSGNELTPDFNGIEPDSLSIRYIPSSEVKKADREERYQKITLKENGSFQLPETENSYIVEIQAVWDNDTYEGDCTYRFKVNSSIQ